MEIFQKMASELDTEGRYLFLNALANQLRYPNNHTHYFSCVLLYLFSEAKQVGFKIDNHANHFNLDTASWLCVRSTIFPPSETGDKDNQRCRAFRWKALK